MPAAALAGYPCRRADARLRPGRADDRGAPAAALGDVRALDSAPWPRPRKSAAASVAAPRAAAIDTNRRAPTPRSRAEAKARARSGTKTSGPKADRPPTWRSSAIRGIAAAAIFAVLLLLIFKRPPGAALGLGGFMLVFYIPAGYYIDMTLWRRRERARMRANGERAREPRRRDAHGRPDRRELLPAPPRGL